MCKVIYTLDYEEQELMEEFAENYGFDFWKQFPEVRGYVTYWDTIDFLQRIQKCARFRQVVVSVVTFDSENDALRVLESAEVANALTLFRAYKIGVVSIQIAEEKARWTK